MENEKKLYTLDPEQLNRRWGTSCVDSVGLCLQHSVLYTTVSTQRKEAEFHVSWQISEKHRQLKNELQLNLIN